MINVDIHPHTFRRALLCARYLHSEISRYPVKYDIFVGGGAVWTAFTG